MAIFLDESNWTDIAATGSSSLSFGAGGATVPTQTTYYRAIVKATSGSPSATAETSIQIVPSGPS